MAARKRPAPLSTHLLLTPISVDGAAEGIIHVLSIGLTPPPPQLIQLWRDGRFPFEKLITDYTLDQINQGFDDSKPGKTSEPVITF